MHLYSPAEQKAALTLSNRNWGERGSPSPDPLPEADPLWPRSQLCIYSRRYSGPSKCFQVFLPQTKAEEISDSTPTLCKVLTGSRGRGEGEVGSQGGGRGEALGGCPLPYMRPQGPLTAAAHPRAIFQLRAPVAASHPPAFFCISVRKQFASNQRD